MKTGRTIQEIGAEILRQSQAKEDYLVNTNSIVMEDWDGKPMLHLRGENGLDLINPLEIQQTAHRQIGDYLGIPRKYYDRMMDSDVGLLAYNVNRWLQGEPEQRMIRTMDGRARAFLSNRYRRIDNLDIARVTLPIIGEMPEARYESCQLTEDYLYIKVVNPRLTAEVTPGDIVQAGIIISNSETGQGSVCVQPLVYRLVCSNGMVVNDAKARRTHLGRASNTEEDFVIYSQETLAADDNERMIGASLEATISGVSNDTVRVNIASDGIQSNRKWFLYSTVYSSPDGTGWYCMPEEGDSVRLYLPNEKEKDGYIISAVHVPIDGEARSIPDNKSLKSKYGKEVLFTPSLLRLTNNNGMSVEISDEDGITISSDKAVTIEAKEGVQIASLEQSIEVVAPESIVLKQGDTTLTMEDDIHLDGAQVHME